MKLKDFDFRIWNKKEKKYLDKDYFIGFKFDKGWEKEVCVFYTRYTHIEKFGRKENAWLSPSRYESNDLEIELSTGVCDIAGQYVYEGDILSFEERGEYAICNVYYNKDEAMFVAVVHDGKEDFPYAIPFVKFIEATKRKRFSVVGNIHRNLELLEPNAHEVMPNAHEVMPNAHEVMPNAHEVMPKGE